MTDCLVICSAETERQVQAIKDHVDKTLGEKGFRLYGLEGTEAGLWVLMDYDDVVVHIFKRGVRETYGLDRLWNDAERIPIHTRSPNPAPDQLPPSQPPRLPKEHSLRHRG
jgi:ribosome-associated protein